MAEGRVFAFRLNPDDPQEALLMNWIVRKARKQNNRSAIIKSALAQAMTPPPDPNPHLARALALLIEKLESGGMSRQQIMDEASLTPEFVENLLAHSLPGRRLD